MPFRVLRRQHGGSAGRGVEEAHQRAALHHGGNSFYKLQFDDLLFHPGTFFPCGGKQLSLLFFRFLFFFFFAC